MSSPNLTDPHDRAVSVRPATAADLPAVMAVYDDQVRTAISTFDLEPPPESVWRQRLEQPEPGDHFLVAEVGGRVVGHARSGGYRPRPAYRHTREVSIYLADDGRGRGVGRALYDELHARMAADDVHAALAVVALPNPASEALHRALGYERVGVLAEVGHKLGRWVDTALYQRLL
ncbi:GNAT family N-acetyltransferase [Nocardioides sp. SYSU D00038]|uniref:GNAT family N-acetyltransferase n=1 Tax=Nocardioides sp. SYSU D00038 TaxID=2812554 RepID=UPI0019684738|nr:GNAT family N-acetyltransferase [Nocardioides sp. SYSU D00038]